MKLLNRLTMMANRSPAADNCPSKLSPCLTYPVSLSFCLTYSVSLTLKRGLSLSRSARAFRSIFGGRADSKCDASKRIILNTAIQPRIRHPSPLGERQRSVGQHLGDLIEYHNSY
jgi:hypothetical protein